MSTGGNERARIARALEIIYLTIAIVIGLALFASGSWIAEHWLAGGGHAGTRIEAALTPIAGIVFGQWMAGFYLAGLNGLERYRPAATIKALAALTGHGGNLIILHLSGGDIAAFMSWQCLFAVILALGSRLCFIAYLPLASGFDWGGVRSQAKFVFGVGCIGLTGVLITNLDKVVLSHLLDLKDFGCYSMAVTVVSGMYLIIAPLYNLTFPRLSYLVHVGNSREASSFYWHRSQLMAWLIAPIGLTMAAGAYHLVYAWTGRPDIAEVTGPLVTLLAIGTTANALMNVPFALQLAHGKTSLGLKLNILMLAVQVPTLFFLVPSVGALGGAAAWACCNLIYLFVGITTTQRILLPGEPGRWWRSVGLPLMGAAPMAALTMLMPTAMDSSRLLAACGLSLVGVAALIGSTWAARILFPSGPLAMLVGFIRSRRPGVR